MIDTNFEFEKLDRNQTWKKIFETIDSNFDKVVEYLASIGSRINTEIFKAKEGQVNFTLSTKYNTARNCLTVYVNNSRQWLNTGFLETSDNSFKLVTPASEGDIIVAVSNRYYTLADITSDAFNNILSDIEDYIKQANANATSSKINADFAEEYAISAESYTHGGTNSREGEDEDNAEYWYNKAKLLVGNALTSFNGRHGDIQPAKGDYSADLISYGTGTVADELDRSKESSQYAMQVDSQGYISLNYSGDNLNNTLPEEGESSDEL